jgi:hypothetical protein
LYAADEQKDGFPCHDVGALLAVGAAIAKRTGSSPSIWSIRIIGGGRIFAASVSPGPVCSLRPMTTTSFSSA